MSVVSYGWEVEANEEFVTLACSRANAGKEHEQLSGIITIPRDCIESVTVLET